MRTRRRWRVLPAHVSQLRPNAVPLRIEDEPDYENNWVDDNGSSEEEPDQESQSAPISSQLANQIAADSALPVTDNQKNGPSGVAVLKSDSVSSSRVGRIRNRPAWMTDYDCDYESDDYVGG